MKKIILYLIIAFLFSGCAAKRNFQNARQVNTIKAYEEFLANFLNENPFLKIRFEGHTDCIGTSHIKKRLSDTRANTLKKEIIKIGISGIRLISKNLDRISHTH